MSLSYIRQRDARLAVHHGVCRQPLRTTPPEAVSQWEAMRCVCVDRTDPVGARAHAAHEHALLHRPWGLARVPKVDVCRRRGARCRWRAVPQWLWSTTTTMTSTTSSTLTHSSSASIHTSQYRCMHKHDWVNAHEIKFFYMGYEDEIS